MSSLFEYNENGEIVYVPSEAEGSETLEGVSDPEQNEVTEGGADSGSDVIEVVDSGTVLPSEVQIEEIPKKESETEQTVYLGDSYNIELLSDEIQELIVNSLAPASGTIGSSTLDYFDRIVSGLPSDVVYIAYRTSSSSSYDGVLYYSDDFDLSDNVVSFGEDTTEVRVVRSNYNGQNNVTQYYESSADGASIAYDMDGDIVYYTNAVAGYPILGGTAKPFDYSPLIAIGLLCVMALAVLQRIFLKR